MILNNGGISLGRRKIDLTGKEFGKLTVLHIDKENRMNYKRWVCKCECGNKKSIIGGNLTSGNTTSCGCTKVSKKKKRLSNIDAYFIQLEASK